MVKNINRDIMIVIIIMKRYLNIYIYIYSLRDYYTIFQVIVGRERIVSSSGTTRHYHRYYYHIIHIIISISYSYVVN